MLDEIFGFISTDGLPAIKRICAGILSLLTVAGSSLDNYAGDTQRMLADALSRDTVEITSEFELDIRVKDLQTHIDALNEYLEKEVEYANKRDGSVPKGYFVGANLPVGLPSSGSYSIYYLFKEDLEFTPIKLIFPEKDIPGIYESGKLSLDGSFTYFYDSSLESGSLNFDINNIDGNHAVYFDSENITFSKDLTSIALEFVTEDVREICREHFPNLALSLSTETFIDMLFEKDGKLSKILDETSLFTHYVHKDFRKLTPDEILTLLSDEGFTSGFMKFLKEYTKPVTKEFVKRTVDGCDARIFEFTGSDYLEYIFKQYDFAREDKVIDAYKSLVDYVHTTENLSEFTKSGLFEERDRGKIATSLADYTHRMREVARVMSDSVASRPLPNVSVLRSYYENARLKHTIYEKDGETHSGLEFLLTHRKDYPELISLKINTVISNSSEKAPTIPSEDTINAELLDNKLAQRTATKKGVKALAIQWDSKMTSGADTPEISETAFEVEYKNEEKSRKVSTAHLVDNSVYLPLRQLMENAGYEVSWDASEYKAYVTIDGKKIEMTGKLIDSKTYVKVRDFEKLGATVEYSEEIEYANAYDDFSKSCRATIFFSDAA